MRSAGGKFGRKPKLMALQIDLARKQIERGEDRVKIAESFKVNRTTVYRALGRLTNVHQKISAAMLCRVRARSNPDLSDGRRLLW